jgi:hypothetical protein
MAWNGKDFIDDLSTKLGDTSNSFKSKVLEWTNEGLKDITSRHNWAFSRVLGKKVLTASQATQDISLGQPTVVSVAAASGGSLTADSAYKVLVTYYEGVAEVESIGGVASASVTPTGANLTIDVTSIPVSGDPLVTARKVYLSLAGGNYYLYSTISDNTSTTLSITADVTVAGVRDVLRAPRSHAIRSLDGNPFLSGTRTLRYIPLTQIIDSTWATNTSGTPDYWSDEQEEKLYLYPKPSSALTLSYYYYKIPTEVTYSLVSFFDVPEWLRPDLDRFVTWKGYEYRDRNGQESKINNFEQMLDKTISKKGAQKKVPRRVQDVVGDSDGYPIL